MIEITDNKEHDVAEFLDALSKRSYFFDSGLRFECVRCGACCTGDPGVVFIPQGKIAVIADYLEISHRELKKQYLYPYSGGFSVREFNDGRCFFFGENGCTIYPVRPVQCMVYPFWFENLKNQDEWQRTIHECKGIGKGRLYTKEDILHKAGLDRDER